jgi:hypothetical protein
MLYSHFHMTQYFNSSDNTLHFLSEDIQFKYQLGHVPAAFHIVHQYVQRNS